jgi:hypothetical protein
MKKSLLVLGLCLLSAGGLCSAAENPKPSSIPIGVGGESTSPGPGENLIILDSATTEHSTFSSHIRRHVSVGDMLFVSYLKSAAPDWGAQRWRLVGVNKRTGRLRVVQEAVNATYPPCVDRTVDGDVVLSFFDWNEKTIQYYRFIQKSEYIEFIHKKVPTILSQKFSCYHDPKRGVTYFFANGGNLVTLDHDGGLVRDTLIVVNDDISVLHYPQILVDGHGRLHSAWTTTPRIKFHYLTIHYAFSDDSGWTFRVGVNSSPLSLPMHHADAIEIIGQTEEGQQRWLASMLPSLSGGMLFGYSRNRFANDLQGYFDRPQESSISITRLDLETGRHQIHDHPIGGDHAPQSYNGFLTRSRSGNVYFTGIHQNRTVVVFRSGDEGATWTLHRRFDTVQGCLAEIGGMSDSDESGLVWGSVTERLNGCLGPQLQARTLLFAWRAD